VTSSVLDKNKIHIVFQLKRYIGTQVETSPKKSSCQLSKSSAHMERELLKYVHIKLQPYNDSFLRMGSNKLVLEGSRISCQWISWSGICAFLEWGMVYINGNVNSKNNRHWCSENPHAVHGILHLTLEVGVWCAVSAHKFTRSVLLQEIINNL